MTQPDPAYDFIYAKVVADSISPEGVRLTTWEKRHHRFVLAEENTHAAAGKNSASSRARPIEKVIDDVRTHPAIPVVWASEKKGMSGGVPVSDEVAAIARRKWDLHREETIRLGHELRELGVHKSISNRLLEPHSMHVAVWSATAIDNYFDQRDHEDAQPEIQVVAARMREAQDASTPLPIGPGEWHLPYIGDVDRETAPELADRLGMNVNDLLVRVSAARVARTSYMTQDGVRDMEVDLGLYSRLADDRLAAGTPPHWSPLEQVAIPCAGNRQEIALAFGNDLTYPTKHLPKVGKYAGWISMRHITEAKHQMVTFR